MDLCGVGAGIGGAGGIGRRWRGRGKLHSHAKARRGIGAERRCVVIGEGVFVGLGRALWRVCAIGGVVIALVGCHRREMWRNPAFEVSGVRLYTDVSLGGAAHDTLRVGVWGWNTTRQVKMLTIGGGCSQWGDALHVVVAQGARRWDSDAWRAQRRLAAEAKRQADSARRAAAAPPDTGGRRHTTPRLVLGEVCTAHAIMAQIAPGDSGGIISVDLPVAAIIGDSLPPGLYRVRASYQGKEGRVARGVPKGEVVLR